MKIHEYNQMKAWLTRPGSEEKRKKSEEANAKYLADRKAATLKRYGITETTTADNSRVLVVNGDLTTEKQLKEQIDKDEDLKNLNNVGKRIIENGNPSNLIGPIDQKIKDGKTLTPEEQSYINYRDNPYGLTPAAAKFIKDETAPSSIQQYHEKKLLEKNKPIKKVVPKKIEVQKPDPIISDPITVEDTYKQKLLDEPTWEQIKQGFKDKAAAAVKADEEAARKQGGIVWLNWRNPII
jgi:hypothetical protein